jgi:hypothetical protein
MTRLASAVKMLDRVADAENMGLGQMIEALKRCKPEADVVFDFCGFVPNYVCSYRGLYSQLAIGYRSRNEGCSVSQMLCWLEESVGKAFAGYKGGSFVMDADTPLWADEYGHCSSTAIVGVKNMGSLVVIETKYSED